MALAAALLTRQRVALASLETVPGTAEVLDITDGIANVYDAQLAATIPASEREGQAALSPIAPVPGARMGKATVKTELVSSTFLTSLLNGCGLAGTPALKPVTGAFTTISYGHYIAGRVFAIAGAMGTFTLDAEAGKPGMLDFEFDGVWQVPTTVTLPVPAFPVTIPPRVASCTFTIGAAVLPVSKVQIVMGNTLVMREDITTVSGYCACCIPTRKTIIRVSPEAGTKDWFADHLLSTGAAMNLVIGTITIAAPNLVLLNPPGYEDANGIYRDSLDFLACRSTSLGDDELSITFA